MKTVKDYIRTIPDFPHAGIRFRDVTTLFGDPRGFRMAVDQLLHPFAGDRIDKVAGLEARGFILGSALAYKLGTGITLVRKPGKLPYKTRRKTYQLEYGTDTLEIHEDAFKKGDRVIVADDLLATGGTVSAVVDLVQELGAEVVECAFLAELEFLEGRKRLPSGKVFSLLKF